MINRAQVMNYSHSVNTAWERGFACGFGLFYLPDFHIDTIKKKIKKKHIHRLVLLGPCKDTLNREDPTRKCFPFCRMSPKVTYQELQRESSWTLTTLEREGHIPEEAKTTLT